jgi:LPXTG-motif cell wall-anchored protein
MEGGTPVQFLHGENTNERKENLMKNFKKVMALLIAAMMIVGTMNIGVVAADFDEKIEITGLTGAKEVDFYQILKWVGSVNGTTVTNDNSFEGWAFTDTFKDAFATATSYANDAAAIKALLKTTDPSYKGITAEYAKEFVSLLGTTPTPTAQVTVSGDKVEYATDTETKIGLYMGVIKTDELDVVYNPVFVSSDWNKTANPNTNTWEVELSEKTYSNNAAAKKSRVSIEKTAEADASTAYDVNDLTWKSTRYGEKVNYTVDTTIPGYGPVFDNPHFVVKDTLDYLELTGEPVVVAPAGLTKGTDYTVSGGAGDKAYTITFDPSYLKKVTAPTAVQITYTAVVTTAAPANVNLEKNEVWIEYNHNHYDEDDYNYQKDDTVHYTFTIDADLLGGYESNILKSGSEVVKVGKKPDGTPITSKTYKSQVGLNPTETWEGALEGAHFRLLDMNKNQYVPVSPIKDEKGNIIKFDYTDFTSQADGRFRIPGLDAGTYYIEEIQAPAGYLKDTKNPVEVVIEAFYSPEDVEMYTDGNTWSYTSTGAFTHKVTYQVDTLDYYTVTIGGDKTTHTFYNKGKTELKVIEESCVEKPHQFVNTQGVELPSTGGMGTTLFYAIGAVLVLGAGILLVSKRRMSAY